MTAPATRRTLSLDADGRAPRALAQACFYTDPGLTEVSIRAPIAASRYAPAGTVREYHYVQGADGAVVRRRQGKAMAREVVRARRAKALRVRQEE